MVALVDGPPSASPRGTLAYWRSPTDACGTSDSFVSSKTSTPDCTHRRFGNKVALWFYRRVGDRFVVASCFCAKEMERQNRARGRVVASSGP